MTPLTTQYSARVRWLIIQRCFLDKASGAPNILSYRCYAHELKTRKESLKRDGYIQVGVRAKSSLKVGEYFIDSLPLNEPAAPKRFGTRKQNRKVRV